MLKTLQNSSKSLTQQCGSLKPHIAVILGSGMSEALEHLNIEKEILFTEIPGFIPPNVMGHKGIISLCKVGNKNVAFLRGRKHLYEGCSPEEIVFPLRVLGLMGVQHILLTNAAGSLNPSYKPGDFMLLNNHINFQGASPVVGNNQTELGPRFFDMTYPYDQTWAKLAINAAKDLKLTLHQGVYAGVLGPNFETASEVKMLHQWGGDAVGMSTLCEVIAARHMAINVCVVSMITNFGAGLANETIDHEEVLDLAKDAGPKLINMLIHMIKARCL